MNESTLKKIRFWFAVTGSGVSVGFMLGVIVGVMNENSAGWLIPVFTLSGF